MSNDDILAQQILDVLFEDAGEGLTKHEIAVLLDVDANKVRATMNAARVLAKELGQFIPTPVADDGFKYRMTDDGDTIWASQLFHERQMDGLEKVRKDHADAVQSRMGDLEVEDRLLAAQMRELEAMAERHRAETRSQMVELAVGLRRARREASEVDGGESV